MLSGEGLDNSDMPTTNFVTYSFEGLQKLIADVIL